MRTLVGEATAFEALDDAGTCCTTRTATKSLLVFHTNHPENGSQQMSPYPDDPSWSPAVVIEGRTIRMIGGSYLAEAGTPAKMSDEVLKYNIRDNR